MLSDDVLQNLSRVLSLIEAIAAKSFVDYRNFYRRLIYKQNIDASFSRKLSFGVVNRKLVCQIII